MLGKKEGKESRGEDRVPVTLPVNVGNANFLTRDVSATGVYFEVSTPFGLGESIAFQIEFDTPGGKLLLKCNGEIMRTEDRNGKVGVAVKIVDSVMESV